MAGEYFWGFSLAVDSDFRRKGKNIILACLVRWFVSLGRRFFPPSPCQLSRSFPSLSSDLLILHPLLYPLCDF